MRKAYIICMFLFVCVSVTAQVSFQKAYGKTIREWGTSLARTMDGGYVLTGHSYNGADRDVLVIKTNGAGDTLWSKIYGGSIDDYGNSIQQTSDGGYIIAGNSNSFSQGTDNDVYLIKINSSGDTTWTKTYGGQGEDIAYSVCQSSEGGYIVAGVSGSFNNGVNKMYVIKTDNAGNLLWSRTYGGNSYEGAFSIQQTTDRGYIIAGSTLSFGSGGDVYLVKTDLNGNLQWSEAVGGAGFDRAYFVKQTDDQGFIIAGETSSFGAGATDVFLIKTNSSGSVSWSKTFGSTASEWANEVRQTSDGGYILTGRTGSFGSNCDAYLIKTDHTGNLMWSKAFGGNDADYGYSVAQAADGGYIIGGFTASFGTGAYGNLYLIKTDGNGQSGCNELSAASNQNNPTVTQTNANTIVAAPLTLVWAPSSVAQSFKPNITGICSVITGEASHPEKKDNLVIYPNPSSGIFYVEHNLPDKAAKLEIVNALGELIYQATEIYSGIRINPGIMKRGVYLVRFYFNDMIEARRLVIE
jgi:hypothetical protein